MHPVRVPVARAVSLFVLLAGTHVSAPAGAQPRVRPAAGRAAPDKPAAAAARTTERKYPGLEHWNGRGELDVWSQPGSKPPFNPAMHIDLTKVAKECSARLGEAQWRQDIVMQGFAKAHFDNCAFEEGIEYVHEKIKKVNSLLDVPEPTEEDFNNALSLLGEALHGVQDFYSHSNYVETLNRPGVKLDDSMVVPLWTADGAERLRLHVKSAGLISGTFANSPRRCTAKEPKTHAQLAKDNDRMPAGSVYLEHFGSIAHIAALSLAKLATRQYLAYAFNRWPVLQKRCPSAIAFLPMGDIRTE